MFIKCVLSMHIFLHIMTHKDYYIPFTLMMVWWWNELKAGSSSAVVIITDKDNYWISYSFFCFDKIMISITTLYVVYYVNMLLWWYGLEAYCQVYLFLHLVLLLFHFHSISILLCYGFWCITFWVWLTLKHNSKWIIICWWWWWWWL